MTKLLAIDPGSNKCGIAIFQDGILTHTETLMSSILEAIESTPLTRRLFIAKSLEPFIKDAQLIVSEEPLLLGRNNNGMQRLLGYIEYLAKESSRDVHFIHPMSVKKAMGCGKLDKEEVKGALLNYLSDQEVCILERAFLDNHYDETDAVAIGLTYQIQKGERNATQKGKRKESSKRQHSRTGKQRLSRKTGSRYRLQRTKKTKEKEIIK